MGGIFTTVVPEWLEINIALLKLELVTFGWHFLCIFLLNEVFSSRKPDNKMASETSQQLIGKTENEANEMIRNKQIFHGGTHFIKLSNNIF